MLLKFAIQEFLDDREFQNLSSATIDSYRYHLLELKDFCQKDNIVSVTEVTAGTMKKYFIHCKDQRRNNPTTINTKLKKLRTFFNYMVEIEVLIEGKSPFVKLKPIKEDIRIEAFTDEHIKGMLGYYRRLKTREKTFHAYRDYTMIVVLLGTGMRLGELTNLTWSDIDVKSGTITVFGKKRKQTSIPMATILAKELAEYKIFVQGELGFTPSSVMCTKVGEPITPNGIKCVLKRLKLIVSFKDVGLSAHTFRHTYAKRFLLNGGDVFSLQKILRHESLRIIVKARTYSFDINQPKNQRIWIVLIELDKGVRGTWIPFYKC